MDSELADKEANDINRSLIIEWWVVKILGVVLIVLFFAVLALSSVILWLLPLKETKYTLLTSYHKDTQVIKVEPIEKDTRGLEVLMELYSAQFVVDLHTIDGITEGARLKNLSLMASSETRDFIESQLDMDNNNAIAKKVFGAGITRSIEIKSVTNLAPDAPNTWQVEWEAVESDLSAEVQRRNTFISTLMAETKESKYHAGEEKLNPIGYTVIKYTLRMGNNE